MPRTGDVRCWIWTADGPLPEYVDEEQVEATVGGAGARTNTCFVIAESDIDFSMNIKVFPGVEDQLKLGEDIHSMGLGIKVSLDGGPFYSTQPYLCFGKLPATTTASYVPRYSESKEKLQNFYLRFSSREIIKASQFLPVGGEYLENDTDANLGVIEVRLLRFKDTNEPSDVRQISVQIPLPARKFRQEMGGHDVGLLAG